MSVYCDWLRYFDLQLLSQCGSTYNCQSRSVYEIHQDVSGALSKQPTNNKPDIRRSPEIHLACGRDVQQCWKMTSCLGEGLSSDLLLSAISVPLSCHFLSSVLSCLIIRLQTFCRLVSASGRHSARFPEMSLLVVIDVAVKFQESVTLPRPVRIRRAKDNRIRSSDHSENRVQRQSVLLGTVMKVQQSLRNVVLILQW